LRYTLKIAALEGYGDDSSSYARAFTGLSGPLRLSTEQQWLAVGQPLMGI
jgi:hypothetical protein